MVGKERGAGRTFFGKGACGRALKSLGAISFDFAPEPNSFMAAKFRFLAAETPAEANLFQPLAENLTKFADEVPN